MRIDALLTQARAGLSQCPDVTLLAALRRSAALFLRQSQAWTQWLDVQNTQAGNAIYDFGADDAARVEAVRVARCGNTPLRMGDESMFTDVSPAQPTVIALSATSQSFTLWPTPDKAYPIAVYAVLVPTDASTEIPDEIGTVYAPGIVGLAKAELMSVSPGLPYHDPAGAAIQYQLGHEWIVRAKRRQTSHGWTPMRVALRPFA